MQNGEHTIVNLVACIFFAVFFNLSFTAFKSGLNTDTLSAVSFVGFAPRNRTMKATVFTLNATHRCFTRERLLQEAASGCSFRKKMRELLRLKS